MFSDADSLIGYPIGPKGEKGDRGIKYEVQKIKF